MTYKTATPYQVRLRPSLWPPKTVSRESVTAWRVTRILTQRPPGAAQNSPVGNMPKVRHLTAARREPTPSSNQDQGSRLRLAA